MTEVTVDQDERPLTVRERGPGETHVVEVCVNPKAKTGVMQLRTTDHPALAEVESQRGVLSRALKELRSDNTLISGFWPPELRLNTYLI